MTPQGPEHPVVQKDAQISQCKKYRYRLTRIWDNRPLLPFVMLNPSWADHEKDDRTVSRCMEFAKREGAGGIVVVNLYASRSENPQTLRDEGDPFGPDNEAALIGVVTEAVRSGQPIVCAWGNDGPIRDGDRRAMDILQRVGARLVCLGKTTAGHPRHPLYVAGDRLFEPFP
jgi:hypothetical protein